MRKTIVFIFCLTSQFVFAQSEGEMPSSNQTLKERFSLMKTKSQTYQNYKVIKESVLDGVWKIIQDTLNAKESSQHSVQAEVVRLKAEVDKINLALKQKDHSMNEIVQASTHINALGIDFLKGSFLSLVTIVLIILLVALVLIVGRLKLMQSSIKEKAELFDIVTKEYEDYKRKALDKQTKLSRELQDERNKMHR